MYTISRFPYTGFEIIFDTEEELKSGLRNLLCDTCLMDISYNRGLGVPAVAVEDCTVEDMLNTACGSDYRVEKQ